MKKIITFVLAMLMLFTVVACAKEPTKNNNNNNGNDPEVQEKIWDKKDLDFDGYEFNIMSAPAGGTIYNWDGSDIDCEEISGNEVLDAVYHRNQLIEETYNCQIQWVDAVGAEYVKNILMAGSEEDASMLSRQLWETFDLIEAGLLYDLNDPAFEHLDLSASWYNQSIQKDIAIGGRLYAVNGDMLFTDEVGMWITLFNKSLAEKYMPDVDLYAAVKNGEWTIDMLTQYASLATTELIADDTMTYMDQWGYIGEGANVPALIGAAGHRLAEITTDGTIKLNVFDAGFINIFTKCMQTVDNRFCLLAEDIKGVDNLWDTYDSVFYEGRALFMIASLYRSIKFREMDTDFGILPMPKLDANQTEYYTWSTYNINVVSIPYTCTDPARTSAIMEALFEESSYGLQPSFTINALMYQTTRDDESIEMLELIMDSTIYDIGVVYNFGGTYSVLYDAARNRAPGSVSSGLKKKMNAANEQVNALMVQLGLA